MAVIDSVALIKGGLHVRGRAQHHETYRRYPRSCRPASNNTDVMERLALQDTEGGTSRRERLEVLYLFAELLWSKDGSGFVAGELFRPRCEGLCCSRDNG